MYWYNRYAWTLSDICTICHMYLFKVEEHILTVFTFSQHSLWQVQKYYVRWNIFHSILNSLVYDLDFIFAFINDILILLLYNVNNYILMFLNTVQSMHLERTFRCYRSKFLHGKSLSVRRNFCHFKTVIICYSFSYTFGAV